MGSFFGEESKAATYSPLVCAELILAAGRVTLPVNKNFEHGLLLTEGAATVDGEPVTRGDLAYRPTGRSAIDIEAPDDATLLLIGGKPFEEDLLMWWNFVGRSQDEIASAREDWEAGRRFGSVVEDDHLPLPAPELPTIRLLPRPSRRR